MKLLKLIKGFSRKAKKTIDSQQMMSIQLNILKQGQKKRYKMPDEFKHQDILYEEQLYGNRCEITGITQNNLKSAQFTKQVLQSTRPKLVILGGLNDTEAMALLQQPLNRFVNHQNLTTNKLFCKTHLLSVVQKKLQQNPNYYYDTKKKFIWNVDHLNRALCINDYINAIYESVFLDYKLIYGKPSSVFIYEDLMLTLSLEELQEIFERTVNRIKQKHSTSYQHISLVLAQQLKTYAMYEQPKLYSKEVTYTTALLNRLTKIDSKNLLLMPTCFVKQVSEQVHNMDFQPQSVYRKWMEDTQSQNYGKFVEINTNDKRIQLLQKFAILSILKGFHLELILHQGKNLFKSSIFNQLLGNYTPQQIIKIYYPIKQKYMERLFDIQRQRVKNKIDYLPSQTEFMYMKDQFQTLQKRKQMFLYEYQPKNFITVAQNQEKVLKLQQKIKQIVQAQCDEYEKNLLESYQKGQITKQGIILYTKLVGKANVDLKDRIKLPYFHFNAFRGFYKEYYRDHLLFDQDKKARRLQMKKLRKLENNLQKISKQIKDPQTLRKYLSGQMGPVKRIDMVQDQHGEIDMDAQIDDLKQMINEIGTDQMKRQYEQFQKSQSKQDKEEMYFGKQEQNVSEDQQDTKK